MGIIFGDEPEEVLVAFMGENFEGEAFAGENVECEAFAGENVEGEAFAGENVEGDFPTKPLPRPRGGEQAAGKQSEILSREFQINKMIILKSAERLVN